MKTYHLRYSEDELREVEEKAKKLGLTIEEYQKYISLKANAKVVF